MSGVPPEAAAASSSVAVETPSAPVPSGASRTPAAAGLVLPPGTLFRDCRPLWCAAESGSPIRRSRSPLGVLGEEPVDLGVDEALPRVFAAPRGGATAWATAPTRHRAGYGPTSYSSRRHSASPAAERGRKTRTFLGWKRSIRSSSGRHSAASSKYGEMISRYVPQRCTCRRSVPGSREATRDPSRSGCAIAPDADFWSRGVNGLQECPNLAQCPVLVRQPPPSPQVVRGEIDVVPESSSYRLRRSPRRGRTSTFSHHPDRVRFADMLATISVLRVIAIIVGLLVLDQQEDVLGVEDPRAVLDRDSPEVELGRPGVAGDQAVGVIVDRHSAGQCCEARPRVEPVGSPRRGSTGCREVPAAPPARRSRDRTGRSGTPPQQSRRPFMRS